MLVEGLDMSVLPPIARNCSALCLSSVLAIFKRPAFDKLSEQARIELSIAEYRFSDSLRRGGLNGKKNVERKKSWIECSSQCWSLHRQRDDWSVESDLIL